MSGGQLDLPGSFPQSGVNSNKSNSGDAPPPQPARQNVDFRNYTVTNSGVNAQASTNSFEVGEIMSSNII